MADASNLLGLYVGEVVTNEDPRGLGRVRVRIPGLVEPASAWAWPLGMPGGGQRDRGFFFPPERGAEVGVFFKEGHVDLPYYLPANWGAPGGSSEVPEPAKSVTPVADVPKVKVLETGNWRITLDDRPGEKSVAVIENKTTGDRLEFDGNTAGILIEGKAAVSIKAIGVVSIEGLQVVINGRPVAPGSGPI